MLRYPVSLICARPTNKNLIFYTVSAHCSSKAATDLQTFVTLPENRGNSNANPLKHRRQLEDSKARAEGKILNVAILGVPNSGKSTLINQLVGRQICAHSCKNNTTRHNARAVLTKDDAQVVFLDTPGVVSLEEMKRYKLEHSLFEDPEASCREADLILVLQDVSNRYVREAIDKKILRLLARYQHKCSLVLVLNKLDTIPKSRRIYDLIRKLTCNRLEDGSGQVKISQHDPKWNVESYFKRKERIAKKEGEDREQEKLTVKDVLDEVREGKVRNTRADTLITGMIGWPGFKDVFSISAKTGDGVKDLRDYLLDATKPGFHRFDRSILLDLDPRKAVLNIVKSKLLEYLDHDLPYALKPQLEHWEYDKENELYRISVSVETKSNRHAGSLIGHRGQTIRMIAEEVEMALQDFFDAPVRFNIQPVVPEDLRKTRTLNPENQTDVFVS